jgi:hypothetical protein
MEDFGTPCQVNFVVGAIIVSRISSYMVVSVGEFAVLVNFWNCLVSLLMSLLTSSQGM